MNYILQIYTGSLREKGPEADEIIRGLSGLPAGLASCLFLCGRDCGV